MIKHLKQIEVLDDPARFKYIVAGRRGGKTAMIIEDIVETLYKAPDGANIFYIGPTLMMAKDLIFEEMMNRLDELKWKYWDYVSKGLINLTRKRKFYVIGGEKIRRIRGKKVYKVYLDELAFFDSDLGEVWRAVRPTLSDLRGKAVLCTTPDGKGTQAYDLYLDAQKKLDDGWKTFHWRTIDNPFIDKDEIEAARRELDPISFNQEYNATWESFGSMAYYSFKHENNVSDSLNFDLTFPVDMMLDFNVNPTTLLLGQIIDQKIYIRREYSLKNSSTIETIKRFISDWETLKDQVYFRIFGDSAGNNRSSNTGFSDYFYIKEMLKDAGFRFDVCVKASNPAIIDRVSHVNAWLCNAKDEHRIIIDPGCSELIRDLSSQECIGRIPTDKNNLGHKADALGYYVDWMQTIGVRKKQGTIQL